MPQVDCIFEHLQQGHAPAALLAANVDVLVDRPEQIMKATVTSKLTTLHTVSLLSQTLHPQEKLHCANQQ
jgi:hypothetical protein